MTPRRLHKTKKHGGDIEQLTWYPAMVDSKTLGLTFNIPNISAASAPKWDKQYLYLIYIVLHPMITVS